MEIFLYVCRKNPVANAVAGKRTKTFSVGQFLEADDYLEAEMTMARGNVERPTDTSPKSDGTLPNAPIAWALPLDFEGEPTAQARLISSFRLLREGRSLRSNFSWDRRRNIRQESPPLAAPCGAVPSRGRLLRQSKWRCHAHPPFENIERRFRHIATPD